jgi:hypothetical protein
MLSGVTEQLYTTYGFATASLQIKVGGIMLLQAFVRLHLGCLTFFEVFEVLAPECSPVLGVKGYNFSLTLVICTCIFHMTAHRKLWLLMLVA